ncbi:very short patch repair endonuclease [Kineococcus terrestris]|uniref:very short patch repair endonuclease n=1 Tax=Kineococcus terrestris TaxID=2044856 RepID=UPI0034DB31DD
MGASWQEPGPAPPASSEAAATLMRRTGRRDTRPELALRRELHRRGLRYLVDTTPPGTNRRRRADLVFRGARVAVFVDGCFWHSCPLHLHPPRANAQWWRVKLASVVARDRDTDERLAEAGWTVVRVWEHEDVVAAADRVEALVRRPHPVTTAVPTVA